MAGKSHALADAQLNYEYRAVAYMPPATHYIALFSTMPADDGTGGVELSAGNYSRAGVARAGASWSAPAAGAGTTRQITNAAPVDFGTPDADWAPAGTPCVGFGVFDAATGGTYKGGAAFASSKILQAGDPVSFPAGDLVISED